VTGARVRVWTDPTCPWAWQTSTWIRGLRNAGVVDVEWALFSLELQALPDVPFDQAASRGGTALRALALARSEGGNAAFENLYVAIGRRVHVEGVRISPDIVRAAGREQAIPDVVERSSSNTWAEAVENDFAAAQQEGVFGVPTLAIDGGKPLFGPVVARAPEAGDALTLWEHVRWLARRDDFYELKRWRDRKPGG
jgi:predicted DsbA family dithiol-disulfide isomerase